MKSLLAFLCLGLAAGHATESARIGLPATGQSEPHQVMLLAIDDVSLPLRRNLVLYLAKPTLRPDAVLKPSRENPNAPDYMATHFYGTVLFDSGKFRMWYYAVHPKPGMTDLVEGPICYAESPDGIQWTKPALDQVNFNGSWANNVVALPGDRIEGVDVIKDEADPDPQRRYKMVFNPKHPEADKYSWTMRTATSPDGVRWTPGADGPVNSFMEFSSFYKHDGLYIVNAHIFGRGESGREQGRAGYAWISPDFTTWLQESAPSFLMPEPLVGSGPAEKVTQDHIGVGAADFGNVVVGMYGRWHQIAKKITGTTADLGLVLSNDGVHFREPVKDWVFIAGKDSPPTQIPGKSYPTVLIQTNSIFNYRDETRIYYGRWRNAPYPGRDAMDYWGEVALATLPRDRWGSLGLTPALPTEAGGNSARNLSFHAATEGSVWTTPIRLPESGDAEIVLNADGANALRVELADEHFKLLPQYSGPASGAARLAGGLDCPVAWTGADLSALRGRTIRVRILFSRDGAADPRLYALYLRTAKAPASP